jgi:hypothetical protein
MTLKADLKDFLDEDGNILTLTEQAKTILKFLSKIVSATSQNIGQQLIHLDLKCNTRASGLSCKGNIEAKSCDKVTIEWQCDTCQASGTISNWQGSIWDKQKPTIH